MLLYIQAERYDIKNGAPKLIEDNNTQRASFPSSRPPLPEKPESAYFQSQVDENLQMLRFSQFWHCFYRTAKRRSEATTDLFLKDPMLDEPKDEERRPEFVQSFSSNFARQTLGSGINSSTPKKLFELAASLRIASVPQYLLTLHSLAKLALNPDFSIEFNKDLDPSANRSGIGVKDYGKMPISALMEILEDLEQTIEKFPASNSVHEFLENTLNEFKRYFGDYLEARSILNKDEPESPEKENNQTIYDALGFNPNCEYKSAITRLLIKNGLNEDDNKNSSNTKEPMDDLEGEKVPIILKEEDKEPSSPMNSNGTITKEELKKLASEKYADPVNMEKEASIEDKLKKLQSNMENLQNHASLLTQGSDFSQTKFSAIQFSHTTNSGLFSYENYNERQRTLALGQLFCYLEYSNKKINKTNMVDIHSMATKPYLSSHTNSNTFNTISGKFPSEIWESQQQLPISSFIGYVDVLNQLAEAEIEVYFNAEAEINAYFNNEPTNNSKIYTRKFDNLNMTITDIMTIIKELREKVKQLKMLNTGEYGAKEDKYVYIIEQFELLEQYFTPYLEARQLLNECEEETKQEATLKNSATFGEAIGFTKLEKQEPTIIVQLKKAVHSSKPKAVVSSNAQKSEASPYQRLCKNVEQRIANEQFKVRRSQTVTFFKVSQKNGPQQNNKSTFEVSDGGKQIVDCILLADKKHHHPKGSWKRYTHSNAYHDMVRLLEKKVAESEGLFGPVYDKLYRRSEKTKAFNKNLLKDLKAAIKDGNHPLFNAPASDLNGDIWKATENDKRSFFGF